MSLKITTPQHINTKLAYYIVKITLQTNTMRKILLLVALGIVALTNAKVSVQRLSALAQSRGGDEVYVDPIETAPVVNVDPPTTTPAAIAKIGGKIDDSVQGDNFASIVRRLREVEETVASLKPVADGFLK